MVEPVSNFEDVLAACLDRLEAGASIASCLERYPEHAAQLEPLLRLADQLHSATWPALSVSGRALGRERMHAALARPGVRVSGWGAFLWQGAALLLVLASLTTAWLAWPGRIVRLGMHGATTQTPVTGPTAPALSTLAPTPEPRTAATAIANTSTPTLPDPTSAPSSPPASPVPPTASRVPPATHTPGPVVSNGAGAGISPVLPVTVTPAPTRRPDSKDHERDSGTQTATPQPGPTASATPGQDGHPTPQPPSVTPGPGGEDDHADHPEAQVTASPDDSHHEDESSQPAGSHDDDSGELGDSEHGDD